jgi:hypothetical protein
VNHHLFWAESWRRSRTRLGVGGWATTSSRGFGKHKPVLVFRWAWKAVLCKIFLSKSLLEPRRRPVFVSEASADPLTPWTSSKVDYLRLKLWTSPLEGASAEGFVEFWACASESLKWSMGSRLSTNNFLYLHSGAFMNIEMRWAGNDSGNVKGVHDCNHFHRHLLDTCSQWKYSDLPIFSLRRWPFSKKTQPADWWIQVPFRMRDMNKGITRRL